MGAVVWRRRIGIGRGHNQTQIPTTQLPPRLGIRLTLIPILTRIGFHIRCPLFMDAFVPLGQNRLAKEHVVLVNHLR